MAMPRTIAIGDIHGCLAALEAILAAIRPRPDDTLLTMGDYIDRGPDSRGVIERLLRLGRECRLIPLLGNHDEMLLKLYDGQTELYIDWLLFGGNTTLGSYGSMRPEDIPPEHIGFFAAAGCFTRRIGTFSCMATIWPSCRWRPNRWRRCCGTR